MNRHYESDPRFHAWLAERAPRSAPDDLLQRAMKEVDQMTQERGWLARWPVLRFTTQVGAVAAVAVLAVITALAVTQLLPSVGGPDESPIPTAEVTPVATESVSPSASPTPSPSPTPTMAPGPSPAVEAIQVATCEHPSGVYQIVLPEGWWTNPAFEDDELGPIDACRFFGPREFDVTSGNPDHPVPEGAVIAIYYIENGCVGYINPILSSRETTVDGFAATVSELAFGKEDTNPPHHYEYVVDLAPGAECERGGRFIYAFTTRDMSTDYEENKAILDQMMEAIQISAR